MISEDKPAYPAGSKVVSEGPSKMDMGGERHSGGTGTRSAGSKAGYWPEGGPPVGAEGGADPLGQTPIKGDLEEEGLTQGPHAGSGA